jgi:hypothetical protein
MKALFTLMSCVLLMLTIFSCKESVTVAKYQDPFYDALRKHHVKELTLPNSFGSATTILLDDEWRKIEITGSYIHERNIYDSLLFLISKYEGPDQYQTTIIDYSFDNEKNLVQSWRVSRGDTIDKSRNIPLFKKVTLRLNPNTGNVDEEIDSMKNERIRNDYTIDGRLQTKYIYEASTNSPKSTWQYDYVLGEIDKITWKTPEGKSLLIHYFRNGLPDSTKNFEKDYVVKYQYKSE